MHESSMIEFGLLLPCHLLRVYGNWFQPSASFMILNLPCGLHKCSRDSEAFRSGGGHEGSVQQTMNPKPSAGCDGVLRVATDVSSGVC